MSDVTRVRQDGHAAGVSRLLGVFEQARPGVTLRLWATESGAARRCVYPGGDLAARGEISPEGGSGGVRHVVPAQGEPPLELEVLGNLDGPDLDFLLGALDQVVSHERASRAAAQELAGRYEEINLLYSISEILGSVVSLEKAAKLILTEVADVLQARRASLWLHNAEAGELYLAAGVGASGLAGPIAVDCPDSLIARVFRERQTLNLERGGLLPREDGVEGTTHGSGAFLSVPINYSPPDGSMRTVGVITLKGRTTNARFSGDDARLLAAIASQVGSALENQRLVRDSLDRQRLERELELAHHLQLKLLPNPRGLHVNAEVAARCLPANEVGGDLYHFFQLPGDRLGVMIGDVSSLGFPAALIMAMTMSISAISVQAGGPPASVLRRIHRALIAELENTEMHLSLFYAELDLPTGRLAYANAGHPHAFLIRARNGAVRLGAMDPPIGTVTLDSYQEAEAMWEAGDTLFLFTDGLAEAFSLPSGLCLVGEDELVRRVAEGRNSGLEEVVAKIFAATRYLPPDARADDRTAVMVRSRQP